MTKMNGAKAPIPTLLSAPCASCNLWLRVCSVRVRLELIYGHGCGKSSCLK